MGDDLKPSGLDFGAIIAFVAPGFLALLGLSYHVPLVASWLNLAAAVDQGIGVFLFVLLASISLGVLVSGVRALLVDTLYLSIFPAKYRVPRPDIDWSKVDADKLAAVISLKDYHYRYYQFYSNTAVSLCLLWFSNYLANKAAWSRPLLIGLIATLFALLWSAWDAFSRYGRGINQVFKP
jgi:hypothetical protein